MHDSEGAYPAVGEEAKLLPLDGYAVVIKRAASNYSAYLPDLSGCITTGATVAETVAKMREALAGHLAVMAEYGEPSPPPGTLIATIRPALSHQSVIPAQ